jgi:hypothetical protein
MAQRSIKAAARKLIDQLPETSTWEDLSKFHRSGKPSKLD